MTAGRTNASQASHHWCTPEKYVIAVRRAFGGRIDLDPCSNEYSIVGARTEFKLPERDGLVEPWDFYDTIYVNPPYGVDRVRRTSIKDWLSKCVVTRRRYSAEVIALVPVATNTRHWKEHVFGVADAIAFLYDTRLKFLVNGEPSKKGAPMACAMVYWGSNAPHFEEVFSAHGAVLRVWPKKP